MTVDCFCLQQVQREKLLGQMFVACQWLVSGTIDLSGLEGAWHSGGSL